MSSAIPAQAPQTRDIRDTPLSRHSNPIAERDSAVSLFDCIAVWFGFALAAILHVAAALRYRIDSDESQHLHVVWYWTRGLMQYRDVFDNHAPLFQMLMAAPLAMFGERPESILWMRLLMIPLFLASLWAVYRIGLAAYGPRAGMYAALIAAFIPSYFLCATEFRTDDLWAMFWLLGIAALVSRRQTDRTAALTGLCLGLALCVSMKTTLLTALAACAGLVALVFHTTAGNACDFRLLGRRLLIGVAGFLTPGLLVIGFFAWRHNLQGLYYGAIQHNVLGADAFVPRWRAFIEWTLASVAVSYVIFRNSPPERRWRRVVVFLAPALYLAALLKIWPLFEREHLLPFFPLAAVTVVGLCEALLTAAARPLRLPAGACVAAVFLLFSGLEISVLWKDANLTTDKAHSAVDLIRLAMQLTDRNDYVIDVKGDFVFRDRANFFAAEPLTRRMIKRGIIPDDTPEQAVARHVTVAVRDSKDFSPRTREFLNANYMLAGPLRVPGQVLSRTPVDAGQPLTFTIAIEGEYRFESEGLPLNGTLDGAPVKRHAYLSAGPHRFVPERRVNSAYVVWKKAVDEKFLIRPFEPMEGPSAPRKLDGSLEKILF